LDPNDALPRTLVAIDLNLSRILDLTVGAIRKSLGVSATRMRGDDWRKLNNAARNRSRKQSGAPRMQSVWRG